MHKIQPVHLYLSCKRIYKEIMFPRTGIYYTFPLCCANNLHALLLRCAPISIVHCFCIALKYFTCILLYALHYPKVQYSLPRTLICMPHWILCNYRAKLPARTIVLSVAIQLILLLCAYRPKFTLTILRTPRVPLPCVCTPRNAKFSVRTLRYYSSARWLNFS